MGSRFAIEIEWERLERGLPEERATFGAIGMRVDTAWLTEAHDTFARRVRQKVHLSGYQLAQWLAWNWWRLRWETKRSSLDWQMAHRLMNIGGGFIWPKVECFADGERVLLQASPAPSRSAEPLRYVAEVRETLSAIEFQTGVDEFIELVVEQLRSEGISNSNLQRIWTHVIEEREDPQATWYRRLEAAMGFDPDEATEHTINSLIAEVEVLGRVGVAEIAAEAHRNMIVPSSGELREFADTLGHRVNLATMPRIPVQDRSPRGSRPAWAVGEKAAQVLRQQERLDDQPLSNQKLAELAGTDPAVVVGDAAEVPFSFALNDSTTTARVVLQSPIITNRRFALARLIGDRLVEALDEPFIPIMRSHSYRQKVQRAFAAELLCPFEHTKQQLGCDFSEESQERIAAEYDVSPMLVSTQLVNSGLLGRQALCGF